MPRRTCVSPKAIYIYTRLEHASRKIALSGSRLSWPLHPICPTTCQSITGQHSLDCATAYWLIDRDIYEIPQRRLPTNTGRGRCRNQGLSSPELLKHIRLEGISSSERQLKPVPFALLPIFHSLTTLSPSFVLYTFLLSFPRSPISLWFPSFSTQGAKHSTPILTFALPRLLSSLTSLSIMW